MGGTGIKGNDGKAARLKMSHQFMLLCVLAFITVGTIKSIGTGSWHLNATPNEVRSDRAIKAVSVIGEASNIATHEAHTILEDSNLIQFEFSNLDGEEGQEGVLTLQLSNIFPFHLSLICRVDLVNIRSCCHKANPGLGSDRGRKIQGRREDAGWSDIKVMQLIFLFY